MTIAREYCQEFWRLFAAWDTLAEAGEAEGHGESEATRAAWRAVCEHREGCRDCPRIVLPVLSQSDS
jgi:hypothetical protein